MGVGMPWGQWAGFSVLAWKGHAPWLGWGWAYGLRQGVVVLWSFWKALLLHHPCPTLRKERGHGRFGKGVLLRRWPGLSHDGVQLPG